MACARLRNGSWITGIAGTLAVSVFFSASAPVSAAPKDAALVLVGMILGGAKDLGGQRSITRAGTGKTPTPPLRNSADRPTSLTSPDGTPRGYP